MPKYKRSFTSYSKEKYLLAFLLGAGCMFICALPMMLFNHGYFIYSGDYNAQQIPFYNLANDTIRNGQFGWNWYTDLGTDFMTSYSFYLFGSPFFWLTVLLPRGLVTYSMPFLIAIKHGLASMTAYAYIRRFVKSKDAALIGGLLYASSGFQSYNIFFNHFQDVTALFPLMLIAMEENINNRRKGVFALTVALMAVINYYFFAGQAVFLVLYYLFRMKSEDFRTSWPKFAGLCFEAVVGTMISGFILLPSALAIITNHRVNNIDYGLDMVLYQDRTLVPRVIQAFFMPPDAPASPNLFNSDSGKWASIAAYFPLLSMTGVIAFMRTRKKHWAARLTVACIFCAFTPLLNSLFQAFNFYYYARWFYMPLLIFAMMTAQSLDDEKSDLDFGWNFCAIVIGALIIIGCLPATIGESDPFFFMLPTDAPYFWLEIGIAVACLIASKILFSFRKKDRPFLRPVLWVTAFACVGCIMNSMYFTAASLDGEREYAKLIEHKDEVYEEVTEDNFFRIDVSEGIDNMSMLWQLPNMRAFQSVVCTSIMDFYQEVGVSREVASRANLMNYPLRGLFSVKYYYREVSEDVRSYEELTDPNAPPLNEFRFKSRNLSTNEANLLIPEELPGFEYAGRVNQFEVYENTLYIPMGFAYDTYISEDDADKKTTDQKEDLLIHALTLSDEQISKYGDILTPYAGPDTLTKDDYVKACKEKQTMASSSFSFDSHGFESKITLDKPELVFFSVPYSDGWTAEVNGKKVDVEKVSYGFMAVKADAGENDIVFHYRTPGLTAGIWISVAGIILLAAYMVICRLTRSNKAEKGHTHYYDYDSAHKVKASQEYISGLTGKDNI